MCYHPDVDPITCYFCLNSAALCVMDVRNRGRCHGDATLQYSFAARLPMFAAASKLGKANRQGRGRKWRQEDSRGGSATGSVRMLIILSWWFVLHYAGDNAPGQQERLCTINTTSIRTKSISMHDQIHTFHMHAETYTQGHILKHTPIHLAKHN